MKQMKKLSAVPVSESSKVYRSIKEWLDTYPNKPAERMDYEFLPEDGGLTFAISNQGVLKTHEYILGGYEAQCQFSILYRVACATNDDRMKADEILNSYGEWCEQNIATLVIAAPPESTARPIKCMRNTESALLAREMGIEVHSIALILNYEVNV